MTVAERTAELVPEYGVRMAACAARGHQTVPWRLRVKGVLHTRLLCQRCGCTYVPVTWGLGTVVTPAESQDQAAG